MNVQNAEFIAISEVARFTPSARIERVLGSLAVELREHFLEYMSKEPFDGIVNLG